MEDKKELTEEMRRDVETFSEKQKAVREAKNLEQRKLVIHGRRTGEGKYVRVDGRDEAIMGLEGSTVVRYSLAKKEVLFVVAKGTRAEKEASLQKIDQILAEYDLDEDAKTYYEKIKAALEKSLARNKKKEDIEKGGAEDPTKDDPKEDPKEEPKAPETEEPAAPETEPEKPSLYAKRSELEQQVRSLNRHIQECQSESNAILARASVHGLMPDDEQTLKDNNSQLKEMREQLRKVEEELKKVKEETDKELDKYLDNKKILDDIEKGISPKDIDKTIVMDVLEKSIANREAMLMGDRTFGAEYIAELNAWRKMLDAYKRGDISGIDTKSADGKRDYMDSIREEAEKKYAEMLRKENSDLEEKVKSEGGNLEFLLARREKERAERKEPEKKEPEKKEPEKKEPEKKEPEKKEPEKKEPEKKEPEKKEPEKKEPEKKEPEKKEPERKDPKKEEQRKAETELLRQTPAYITNGGKLGYESLTILDRFRAKRKAYEMANGKKPGLLRSALLILPSVKYSRLADEYIESGELSIDDIVYAKYRREIQYFDEEYERLEEAEKKEPEKKEPEKKEPEKKEPEKKEPEKKEPEKKEPEKKEPEKKEPEKKEPEKKEPEKKEPEKKEPEEPSEDSDKKPKKPLAEKAARGFYRVDKETLAKIRRVEMEAAKREEERKTAKREPKGKESEGR